MTDQIRSTVFSCKYLTKLKFGYKVVCVLPMKAYVGNGGRGPVVLKLGARGAD